MNIASLIGANRYFILNRIPHISRLLVDSMDSVLGHSQTIVTGNRVAEFLTIPERLREDPVPVDFVGVGDQRSNNGNYEGICG